MPSTKTSAFEISDVVAAEAVDQFYQHLHHSQVLLLLERARVQLLSAIGYPIERLMREGIPPVISGIQIEYKREVSAGAVKVSCERCRVEGRRILIEQRLFNGRGKEAVSAVVTSMLMDTQTRRAVSPPPEFVAALAAGPWAREEG